MQNRKSIVIAGLAVFAAVYMVGSPWVTAQQRPAPSEVRVAAVPTEKGGQDIFGPYEVVADWPKDLTTLPGHAGWTFGAGQSVFAESPDRVFVLQRGELPNVQRPEGRRLPDIGPSIAFPIGRLPWRDATTASPPGNGGTGQLAEERDQGVGGKAATRWASTRAGSTASWCSTRKGNLVESWTQWDSILQRPHFVAISPYDPQKHVWIVDDHKHVIYKFTNDGKTKVLTIGTYGVPGDDATHFNRPTFMDWFPDGSFVVADGYNGTRVVKFDKDGKFLATWGEKGDDRQGDAARLLQQRPRHRRRPEDAAGVRQRPRQPARAGVRRERQVPRRVDVRRPTRRTCTCSTSSADGYLWAADRGTNKILKYDLERQLHVLLGHVGRLPRRHVGRARHERRPGRQLLRRRSGQRRRAEVPPARRRESGVHGRQAASRSVEVGDYGLGTGIRAQALRARSLGASAPRTLRSVLQIPPDP